MLRWRSASTARCRVCAASPTSVVAKPRSSAGNSRALGNRASGDAASARWISAASGAGTSPRAGLEWHFAVVDAPEVNAFAVPGGYVYVNRGLIERMDRMDELAGVLAHEIGHVSLRHSAKQMEKQGNANVGIAVFCTLTNLCSGDVARVAIDVAGTAWFAKHSREDEAQADSIAVFSLPQAGIDPEGIPAMFDKLLAERQADPGMLQGWFGTHPLEEDRIARTRALIASLPGTDRGLARDDGEFRAVRERLRTLPPPPPPPRELPQP